MLIPPFIPPPATSGCCDGLCGALNPAAVLGGILYLTLSTDLCDCSGGNTGTSSAKYTGSVSGVYALPWTPSPDAAGPDDPGWFTWTLIVPASETGITESFWDDDAACGADGDSPDPAEGGTVGLELGVTCGADGLTVGAALVAGDVATPTQGRIYGFDGPAGSASPGAPLANNAPACPVFADDSGLGNGWSATGGTATLSLTP